MDLTLTGNVAVNFPFDAVTNSQLRRIRPHGVCLGANKGWEFPLASAESLRGLLGSRFAISEELLQWLHWFKHPLPPLPPHKELIANADLMSVLVDGRKPLPHQRFGVRWLLARKGALLADEMGLGKTLTALLAGRAMVRAANVRIVVIAPVGLHSHWQKEANAVDLKVELFSWASLPKDLPPFGTVLIVDEAHFAQSFHAKRTKSLLRLARHPRLRAIWMLSGTPLKNGRPVQLYPLLAAIDHPLAINRRAFEEYFCHGHWTNKNGRFLWEANGTSNLQELNKLIKPLILYRKKQDLLNLLPKRRELHRVQLSSLEALGLNHRIALVIDNYRERVKLGLVRSDSESLSVLTALRQISAEFKLPFTSKLIKQLSNENKSIVLFSNFIEPLYLLRDKIGGELLTGKQSFQEREDSVDKFQAGSVPLLLCTYGAGGLGLTLHRASHVILLERPWTPGDVDQAEDRCHRIGMTEGLVSHWVSLGFVDYFVDTLLTSKSQNIEFILGSRRLDLNRKSIAKMFNTCLYEFSNS